MSQQPDTLDTLIDRTLARDGERTRSRFAAIPSAQLTAKLALTTASAGLLRTLAGKLALYAGGALVVGGALYFAPQFFSARDAAPVRVAPQVSKTPLPMVTQGTKTTEGPAPQSQKVISSARPRDISPTPQKMTLDEDHPQTLPTVKNPHYLGPLK